MSAPAGERLLDLRDCSADALRAAGLHGAPYDRVELGDALTRVAEPQAFLQRLHAACAPQATLHCTLVNAGNAGAVERFLLGVALETLRPAGTPRAAYASLLAAGWLPDACGVARTEHANRRFVRSLIDAAEALGIAKTEILENLQTQRLEVRCKRFDPAPPAAPFEEVDVVAACANDAVADAVLLPSPGLREFARPAIVVRGQDSAAKALEAARAQSDAAWLLLLREDVHLPAGSGFAISALLRRRCAFEGAVSPAGFAGLAQDAPSGTCAAGLLVERRALWDHPARASALSLDDCALLLPRGTDLDPRLGWELYGTDVALDARRKGAGASVERVPIYRNAFDDPAVGEGFILGASYLAAKYPELEAVVTRRATLRAGRIEKPVYTSEGARP